jgi:hypothetical protein
MSAECNTFGAFAFLFIDFKFVNNFKNPKNVHIWNVHSHVLHNSQYKISAYLRSGLTIDHN